MRRIDIFPKTRAYLGVCTAFLSAKRTGRVCFARGPTLSTMASSLRRRPRACIGRRKKNRISARRIFHQFPSALTDHNRTSTDNSNISDDADSAVFNLDNSPPDILSGSAREIHHRQEPGRTRSTRPISPFSHIIRRGIDSYVDTSPLRFFGKFAHDWSLFKASHRRCRSRNRNRTGLHVGVSCRKRDEKLTRLNGDSEDSFVLRSADWRFNFEI